jgi:fumarate hydratase class II
LLGGPAEESSNAWNNAGTGHAPVNRSLMLVTALSPVIGYDKASAIAHRALENNQTLREASLANGFIDEAAFDQIVVPANMVGDLNTVR